MRKPSRMPFFYPGIRRQPLGREESGSAERARPAFKLRFEYANTRRSSSVYRAAWRRKELRSAFRAYRACPT